LRFLYLLCAFIFLSSCGGDKTLLVPSFGFFIPFGEARGEAGGATIANDRAPVAESFAVNEEYCTLFEPAKLRLLLYDVGGKLIVDKDLSKIAPKEAGQRHYLAAPSLSGTAWVAVLDSVQKARGYHLYHITGEEQDPANIAFIPASPYELKYTDRSENFTPRLESMVVLEGGTLMLVWHAWVQRSYSGGRGEESVSVISLSLVNEREKTVTTHRLDFERLRQTESGVLRFDSVMSVHHMGDLSRFLIEVQYRKTDTRNPYERALYVFDTTENTLHRIDTPRPVWNSVLGIARDGTLFFLDEVDIYRDSTRAIISVYDIDTQKENRYAIEADPARPSMSGFSFSRRGVLYSLEVFDRGINFYTWK
jgi:hypothetical protein